MGPIDGDGREDSGPRGWRQTKPWLAIDPWKSIVTAIYSSSRSSNILFPQFCSTFYAVFRRPEIRSIYINAAINFEDASFSQTCRNDGTLKFVIRLRSVGRISLLIFRVLTRFTNVLYSFMPNNIFLKILIFEIIFLHNVIYMIIIQLTVKCYIFTT